RAQLRLAREREARQIPGPGDLLWLDARLPELGLIERRAVPGVARGVSDESIFQLPQRSGRDGLHGLVPVPGPGPAGFLRRPRARHRPRYCGGRFSTKARAPSLASSVMKQVNVAVVSSAIAVVRSTWTPDSRASLASSIEMGAFSMIVRARASAPASTSSFGTARLTSPRRAASRPSKTAPVMISSLALAKPTAR